MGLKVRSLGMRSFRNFSERDLELADGLTVLVGPNATGKTNSVEALQMLTGVEDELAEALNAIRRNRKQLDEEAQ